LCGTRSAKRVPGEEKLKSSSLLVCVCVSSLPDISSTRPPLKLQYAVSLLKMTSYNANLYPDASPHKKRPGITSPKSIAGFIDNLWAGFNNLNVLLLPKRIHFIELEDQPL